MVEKSCFKFPVLLGFAKGKTIEMVLCSDAPSLSFTLILFCKLLQKGRVYLWLLGEMFKGNYGLFI